MHSFVKFLSSSDNKTKPLEDTATVKLWKTVAWAILLSECFLKLCAQMQHNVLTLTFGWLLIYLGYLSFPRAAKFSRIIFLFFSFACMSHALEGEIETIWLEVSLPNSKPILFCSAYRPPSATVAWIDLFTKQIERVSCCGNEIIISGDMNINLLQDPQMYWSDALEGLILLK